MRSLSLRLLVMLLVCSWAATVSQSHAATEYTAHVWLTNTPAGLTTNIVINIGAADTRDWTNDASGAISTTIQITNSVAASRTNLHQHLQAYPVYSAGATSPRLFVYLNPTNTTIVDMVAPLDTNITVTFGGNWAHVVYETNSYTDAAAILNRTNAMSSVARTNAENAIVNLLGQNRPTNAVPPNATFLRNYTDTTTAQSLSNKTLIGPIISGGRMTTVTNLTGTNVALTNVMLRLVTADGVDLTGLTSMSGIMTALTNGTLRNAYITGASNITGTVTALTNGYWTNAILGSPTTTNLANYGNAISSPGPTGTGSEQFGTGASATNSGSLAVGQLSSARGAQAFAGGYVADAEGTASTALGASATARATWTISLGQNSYNETTATNGIAIGAETINNYHDAIAIGTSVTTTEPYEVRIGGTDHVIRGARYEGTLTNAVMVGTNRINGRLDYTPRANTGLANGYNSDVLLGTNVYVRLSGPTAAYTNVGFRAAAAVDGTFHIVQADNPGLSLTILDNSGLDATAANRILTGRGSANTSTNNPVVFRVLYDGAASRWRVLDWPPN